MFCLSFGRFHHLSQFLCNQLLGLTRASVKQPLDCHAIQNHQAIHFIERSMVSTVKNSMIRSLFLLAFA